MEDFDLLPWYDFVLKQYLLHMFGRFKIKMNVLMYRFNTHRMLFCFVK